MAHATLLIRRDEARFQSCERFDPRLSLQCIQIQNPAMLPPGEKAWVKVNKLTNSFNCNNLQSIRPCSCECGQPNTASRNWGIGRIEDECYYSANITIDVSPPNTNGVAAARLKDVDNCKSA